MTYFPCICNGLEVNSLFSYSTHKQLKLLQLQLGFFSRSNGETLQTEIQDQLPKTNASAGSTSCCFHMSRLFCRILMLLLFGSDFNEDSKEEGSGHAKHNVLLYLNVIIEQMSTCKH